MTRPVVAYIDQQALCHNYQLLQKKVYPAIVIAVVKANAYGHGLTLVSTVLYELGCRHFAVTDTAEAMLLRKHLGNAVCILVLSGIFDQQEALCCADYQLTPFVTEQKHLLWLKESQFTSGLWIKINSGMHRLGGQDVMQLIRDCHAYQLNIIGICSHLACADIVHHPLNQAQIVCMQQWQHVTQLPVSLLNSAGILSMSACSFDFVRPGIALYGANPLLDDRETILKPVMHLCARVMQIRDVLAGAFISYAATYKAKKDMRVALVPLGYADGLPRALSNCGHAYFEGLDLAIVGRVCMDYCLLDVSNITINLGDEVCFWGDTPLANDVASVAGTISYTLFTGVSPRVPRVLRT